MNNSNKTPVISENMNKSNLYYTKTLWVGDLDKIKDEIVDENYILYCMFYEFTEDIIKIKLCKEKNSQKNSYAFIEFSNFEIAKYCFDHLNGKWIPGKIHKFKLNWAKYNVTDSINQNEKNLNVELDDKGTYSIYVGNLPLNTTKEEVENLFCSFYNSVCFVKMIKNNNKNQNKIYCFIHFFNYEECIRALREMDGYMFKGNKIKVSKSNGIKMNNTENNNYYANKNYDLNNNNLNNTNISNYTINKNNIMNHLTDEQKKNNNNYYFYYNNANNELNNTYKINYYGYDPLNSSANSFPGYSNNNNNNNNNMLYNSNNYSNHINQINNYGKAINQLNNYNMNCTNKTENNTNYSINSLNYMNNFNYIPLEKNEKIDLYDKKEINNINDMKASPEENTNIVKENEIMKKKINSFYENSCELNLQNNSFSNEDYNNHRNFNSKNNGNVEDNNNNNNYDDSDSNYKNKLESYDDNNRNNDGDNSNNNNMDNNNNNYYYNINNNMNSDNIDNNNNNNDNIKEDSINSNSNE